MKAPKHTSQCLAELALGEYIASISWDKGTEENVGLKVTEKWVFIFRDPDDPENVVRLSRRNKNARVYFLSPGYSLFEAQMEEAFAEYTDTTFAEVMAKIAADHTDRISTSQ